MINFYSRKLTDISFLIPIIDPFESTVFAQRFTVKPFLIFFKVLSRFKSLVECVDVLDYDAIAVLLEKSVVDVTGGRFSVWEVDWRDFNEMFDFP